MSISSSTITLNRLTKDYGESRGVFDVSLAVERGEVFGFLGPNGAGKTTAIRQMMGFIKPQSGRCCINGYDCTTQTAEVQKSLGYIPGEIALLDTMTGLKFIEFMARYRGMRGRGRIDELIERFELDPRGRIKKMSKGMKQKIGIVCAFMHDPAVLVLDEPTSGLDPLMQSRFIDLILEERDRCKTVFMSSHIFEEVERTCSRVGIIRAGHLVAVDSVAHLKASRRKNYVITLETGNDASKFVSAATALDDVDQVTVGKGPGAVGTVSDTRVTVRMHGEIEGLIALMGAYPVVDIDVEHQSLEDIFMHFYGGDGR